MKKRWPMESLGYGSGKSPVFTTTHWSVVLSAGQESCPAADAALAKLCEMYRQPIYAFAHRTGSSHEDAEDLTQGFFVRMIETRGFRGLDAKKGRFRSYLLKAFKHFRLNEWRSERAQKRGGGKILISLDDESAKAHYENCCSTEISAEKFFDREWANTLLGLALKRLRSEYAGKGKRKQSQQKFYKACIGFLTREEPTKGYSVIAKKLGTKATALKMRVKRMRERFDILLRAEIAQTVSSPEEIESELRALRAALSS